MIDIDWNNAWREAQLSRRAADDPDYWNSRAPSYAKTSGSSPYATKFLQRANLQPGQTVFDMGCGSGTLALPLARRGFEVFAADFSTAMIELMMRRAKEEGVDGLIHPIELSWDEDWDARELPVCDVAFASRSIATMDMQSALAKLDARAKKRVCITLSMGASPRSDEVLLRVVGRPRMAYPDYIFGMNILWQMGILPELSYIHSTRASDFDSFEHAIEKTCEIIEATPEERERLIEYSRGHLHPETDKDGNECWRYDHVRTTSWAFISWDK